MRAASDRSGVGVVGLAALLLVVSSIAVVAGSGELRQPVTALVFAAFVAVGELVRITLPGDRDEAPLATGVALAYALALIALHRASAPLGVAETPLLIAAGAGGVAYLEGSLTKPAGRWILRGALVVLTIYVVLTSTLGSSVYSFGGGVSLVGSTVLLLLLWAATSSLVPSSGGARPLLLALAVGAGISALSTTAGAALRS